MNEQSKLELSVEAINQQEIDKLIDKIKKLKTSVDSLTLKKQNLLIDSTSIKVEINKIDKEIRTLYNKSLLPLTRKKFNIHLEIDSRLNKEQSEALSKIKEISKTMDTASKKQQANLLQEREVWKNTYNTLVKQRQELAKFKLNNIFPSKYPEAQELIKNLQAVQKQINTLTNKKLKLGMDLRGNEAELKKITESIKILQIEKNRLSSKALSLGNANAFTKAGNAIKAMASVFDKMSAGVMILSQAFGGLSSVLMNLGKAAIKEAVEWEILRMKLSNFYNTASEANEAFSKLVKMAQTTPFEIKGLVQAAVMLKSFGLDIDKTINLAGNLAAAMGGDVKDAGYAVARAMSGASMGFLMLQRSWGISYAKLKAFGAEFMAGNRLMASSEKTQRALVKVLDLYNGSMERMSSTVTGRLSNLKDAFDTLKASATEGFLPIMKDAITTATNFVNTFNSLPGVIKSSSVALVLIGGVIAGVASSTLNLVYRLNELGAGLKIIGTYAAANTTLQVFGATALKTAGSIAQVSSSALTAATSFTTLEASAGTAVGLGGMAAAIPVAGAVVAALSLLVIAIDRYYAELERKKGMKIEEEMADFTKNVNELAMAYGGSKSAVDIFNQALAQSPKEFMNLRDAVYQYEGKINSLFTTTQEQFIKEKQLIIEQAKNRVTFFEQSLQDINARKKEIEDKWKGTNIRLIDDVKEMESLDHMSKKLEEYFWTSVGIANELSDKYKEAAQQREKLDAEHAQKLTEYQRTQKYQVKENSNLLLQESKQILDILKMEGLTSKERNTLQKEYMVIQDKINKFTVSSVTESHNTYMKNLNDMRKAGAITLKEFQDMSAAAIGSYMAAMSKAFGNKKDFTEIWKNYLTTQKNALKEGTINEKEYLDSLTKFRDDNLNEYETASKTKSDIDKEITSATINNIKTTWANFSKEQKVFYTQGTITQQQYVDALKGFLTEHTEELKNQEHLRLSIEQTIANESKKINKASMDDIIKIRVETLEAIGNVEEAHVQKALLNLQKEYKEQVKQNGQSLELYKWYIAQRELIFKEHNDRMRDATIEMQADILKATTERSEKADYVTGLNNLQKQKEEYEKLGKSKVEVDQWYTAMKKQLDDKYINDVYKNNIALFKSHQELYNKIIELEHNRLVHRLSGNAALKEESDYLTQQIAVLTTTVEKEKVQGETLRLRLLAGQQLKDVEKEILNTYLEDVKALDAMEQSQDNLLKKSVEMFDSSLEAMKSYYGILVAQGKMTQDQMDKIVATFTVDYAKSWNDYIQPILEKAQAGGGIQVLAPNEQEALNTFFETIQVKGKDAAQTLADMGIIIDTASMGLVTFGQELYNTSKAADTASDSAKTLGNSADTALTGTTNGANQAADSMNNLATATTNAADAMVQYGNISAKALNQKTGNFMSMEQAISNLPGTSWSPIGDATGDGTYGRQSSADQNYGRISYNTNSSPVQGVGTYSSEPAYDVQAYGEQGLIQYAPSIRPYDNPLNDSKMNREGRIFTQEIIGKSSADAMFNFLQGTVDAMKGLGTKSAEAFLSSIPGEGTATGFTAPMSTPIPSTYQPPGTLAQATSLFDLDGLTKYLKMSDAMIDKREKEVSLMLDQFNTNMQNFELLQKIDLFQKKTDAEMTDADKAKALKAEENALKEKQKMLTSENNALKENVDIIKEKVDTKGISSLTDSESELLQVYYDQITALKEIKIRLEEIKSSNASVTSVDTITDTTGTDASTATTAEATAVTPVPRIAPSSGSNNATIAQMITDNLSTTQLEFKNITKSMADWMMKTFGKIPDFVEKIDGVTRNMSQTTVNNNYSIGLGSGGKYPAPASIQPAMNRIGQVSGDMVSKYSTY